MLSCVYVHDVHARPPAGMVGQECWVTLLCKAKALCWCWNCPCARQFSGSHLGLDCPLCVARSPAQITTSAGAVWGGQLPAGHTDHRSMLSLLGKVATLTSPLREWQPSPAWLDKLPEFPSKHGRRWEFWQLNSRFQSWGTRDYIPDTELHAEHSQSWMASYELCCHGLHHLCDDVVPVMSLWFLMETCIGRCLLGGRSPFGGKERHSA